MESGFHFVCDFAEHSTAVECLVKLQCENDPTTSQQWNVMRDTGLIISSSDLTCSSVTAYAFDVYAGVTNYMPSVIQKNVTLDFSFLPPTHPPTRDSSQGEVYISLAQLGQIK